MFRLLYTYKIFGLNISSCPLKGIRICPPRRDDTLAENYFELKEYEKQQIQEGPSALLLST